MHPDMFRKSKSEIAVSSGEELQGPISVMSASDYGIGGLCAARMSAWSPGAVAVL